MSLKGYIKETLKYALRSKPLIHRYVNELEKLYAMSDDELYDWKERRFLEIFRKAYDKSPFYHKLYAEAGIARDDIRTLADIVKLPVVTKDMIREHTDEFLTVPKWMMVHNHTSGTTGTPLNLWGSWPSIWREQAAFVCSRGRWGYDYGRRMVSLRGNLGRTEQSMYVHLSNTLYLSSFNIGDETVEQYYKLIKDFRPVAIEGFPSTIYALAIALRDKGLTLDIPLAFTSSEMLLDYQQKLIEQQLHTEIFDHFGATERTIRLCECKDHSGYYEVPGYSINEYDEEGTTTTSLINDSFPLIRYRMNDVIETEPTTDPHARVKVRKIMGRNLVCAVSKSGKMYGGSLFTFPFKDLKNIDVSQIVQTVPGKLDINIVPGPGFNDADMQHLKKNMVDALGSDEFDYSFNIIDKSQIIYTKRGKFQFVVVQKSPDAPSVSPHDN